MNPDDISIFTMRGIGTCIYEGTLAKVPLSDLSNAPVFTYPHFKDLIQGMQLFQGCKLDLHILEPHVFYKAPAKEKTAGLSRPRYYLIGVHPNNLVHEKNHIYLKTNFRLKDWR